MTLETLVQSYNILAVVPELIMALFGLAVLLCGAFFPGSGRRAQPALALAGVVFCGMAVAALWNRNLSFGDPATAVFVADNFSLFFKWIFLIGLAITIMLSSRFLHARSGDRREVSGEYFCLLLFATVGMMMVASARDLLVVFLGIETLSIALYVLAGFARARLESNEAGMKYLLLGAFSTGFLLYGIALTYAATGSTNLTDIAVSVSGAAASGLAGAGAIISPPLLLAGTALLLIGLGFKAALVPFHQWTPDVYEGSPTPVTALMATGAKAAAFAAILRVFPGALGSDPIATQWFTILLVIAVLTMTIGNVVAIAQHSLKRMLAYSSIAHAGYAVIGVLAAGNATRLNLSEAAERSVVSVLFYLLIYALMTLGAFAVLVYLENARAENDPEFDDENANLEVADLSGLAWKRPLPAAALTIFLFSLAGIPPTAGFFAKLYLFQEAIGQGLIGLVIVGVLNSVISVYYYLRPVVAIYRMDDAAQSTPLTVSAAGEAVAGRSLLSSFAVGFAIALCVAGVLLMIVLQNIALSGAQAAAQLLS